MTPLLCCVLLLSPGAEPVFSVQTANAVARGPLVKLAADWSITLEGHKPFAGADLISLRRTAVPLPPRARGPHVRLMNGDVLAGEAAALANDRLRLRFARRELALPLTALAALWLDQPDREQAERIQRLLAEPRNRDTVWLKNGDALDGTVLRLDSDFLTIDVGGKAVKVERGKLAVLGFNSELARLYQPKQAFGRLTLADGSRISLVSAQADRQTLAGKAVFGDRIELPLDQAVALDLHHGRAVYLSDLKPKAYEEQPYFAGSRWPYRLDRSVAGNDLNLGGDSYDKGIGMHSASRLTYALDGGYRRFEAVVGLDEATGKQGRAKVLVLVDGKARDLGWNGDLTGGAAARQITLDVTGAKELTLVVEFGADGLDVQDHVNWANARLVR
jgi:hypothetical protein